MGNYFVVAVGLCLAHSAAGAPPSMVMMGTSANASITGTSGYHCAANPGPASFQRGAASAGAAIPPAIISLPQVGYSGIEGPPAPAIGCHAGAKPATTTPVEAAFAGVLLLNFTSKSHGAVSFDYSILNSILPSGDTAPFKNYSQVWTPAAGALKVSFNILFQNSTLPVVALFRTIT
jgi:hypothetical protein